MSGWERDADGVARGRNSAAVNERGTGGTGLAVGTRVRLLGGSALTGVIIDDLTQTRVLIDYYGALPDLDVVVGDSVVSVRRWAMLCDDGRLKFVDDAVLERI
jgi:hypothetical protein